MNDKAMNNAVLVVEGVTKRYGAGATEVTAVREVSMFVAPGEVVLIMGPSGSGKTTLLSMLGALLKPTEGAIQLNGDVISALAENRLPDIRLKKFGFIFQDFNLLSALSALENVALVAQLAGAKGREAHQRASDLLTDLGLRERLNFLPEKLSGGEKQRVAIARALVATPALVLADEPTGNLDSNSSREILELLRRACDERQQTIVMVTHDPRAAAYADRIVYLKDGQIVREQGDDDGGRDGKRSTQTIRAVMTELDL